MRCLSFVVQIDVDTDEWAGDYGITVAEVPDDIRTTLLTCVQGMAGIGDDQGAAPGCRSPGWRCDAPETGHQRPGQNR